MAGGLDGAGGADADSRWLCAAVDLGAASAICGDVEGLVLLAAGGGVAGGAVGGAAAVVAGLFSAGVSFLARGLSSRLGSLRSFAVRSSAILAWRRKSSAKQELMSSSVLPFTSQ